jgi:hypothetical protein
MLLNHNNSNEYESAANVFLQPLKPSQISLVKRRAPMDPSKPAMTASAAVMPDTTISTMRKAFITPEYMELTAKQIQAFERNIRGSERRQEALASIISCYDKSVKELRLTLDNFQVLKRNSQIQLEAIKAEVAALENSKKALSDAMDVLGKGGFVD